METIEKEEEVRNKVYVASVRAAKLQYIMAQMNYTGEEARLEIEKAFCKAFPMGQHLYNKLCRSSDVSKWLRSLDSENEEIFFTIEHFNFLND